MNNYAIEVENLEKKFDKFSLGPINLKIPKGSIVGYIGRNGAGKSKTIKLILNLLKTDNGKIRVLGEDIENNYKIKDKIGVVFDDLFLPEELKINDINSFLKDIYTKWDENLFMKYVNKFNLSNDTIIKNYSRGMRMKLSIAIALSHKANLLILDEATSGLDPIVREEILDIILEFMQEEENTVLISSHILSDLEKIADYIAFIDDGKILFFEEKDELKDKYGICSLSDEDLEKLNPSSVIGIRKHAFGNEALVKKDDIANEINFQKPSIEDIMIYFLKGDKK